jgi:hypothetical protein
MRLTRTCGWQREAPVLNSEIHRCEWLAAADRLPYARGRGLGAFSRPYA